MKSSRLKTMSTRGVRLMYGSSIGSVLNGMRRSNPAQIAYPNYISDRQTGYMRLRPGRFELGGRGSRRASSDPLVGRKPKEAQQELRPPGFSNRVRLTRVR